MSTVLVLPVKGFRGAKSRLAPMFSPRQRETLAKAMFCDVLAAACRAVGRDDVLVVSDDRAVADLAAPSRVRLHKPGVVGLNAAVSSSSALLARGNHAMVVVPADIPHVSAAALRAVVMRLSSTGRAVLARATADGGTNIFGCNSADVLAPAFGPNSFARHCERATAAGVKLDRLDEQEFGLDVDRPEDVIALLDFTGGHRTWCALESFGIAVAHPSADVFVVRKGISHG